LFNIDMIFSFSIAAVHIIPSTRFDKLVSRALLWLKKRALLS